jgi:hypothetical protein
LQSATPRIRAAEEEPLNAIQMLKDDHRRVKALFREFEAACERAHQKKQRIAEEAMRECEVHTKLEEEIFYPAAKAKGSEIKDTVDEGLEEHHVVDVLMNELRGMSPEAE